MKKAYFIILFLIGISYTSINIIAAYDISKKSIAGIAGGSAGMIIGGISGIITGLVLSAPIYIVGQIVDAPDQAVTLITKKMVKFGAVAGILIGGLKGAAYAGEKTGIAGFGTFLVTSAIAIKKVRLNETPSYSSQPDTCENQLLKYPAWEQ